MPVGQVGRQKAVACFESCQKNVTSLRRFLRDNKGYFQFDFVASGEVSDRQFRGRLCGFYGGENYPEKGLKLQERRFLVALHQERVWIQDFFEVRQLI